MEKNQREESQHIYDEIVTGMKEWRAAHPKATLREIEQEARKRVSRLEVYLIEERAMANPSRECTWQACEEITSYSGKRSEVGTNLWNLSEMRDRIFSPSMRNWACSQAA